jgi:hypothetical protein
VRTSRRFQLRVAEPLLGRIVAFAVERGLPVSQAIRLLVGDALDAHVGPAVQPASLAALVAAEHAVLMVASILPEGEARMRDLAAQASRAAEERLAVVGEPAAPGTEA